MPFIPFVAEVGWGGKCIASWVRAPQRVPALLHGHVDVVWHPFMELPAPSQGVCRVAVAHRAQATYVGGTPSALFSLL